MRQCVGAGGAQRLRRRGGGQQPASGAPGAGQRRDQRRLDNGRPVADRVRPRTHEKIPPRNKGQPQPNIGDDRPLTVVFVSANLTRDDAKLQLTGPRNATSGPLVATGNNLFQVGLPTGVYRVSAEGIPGAKPARLSVGPFRASSQNLLLLP